MTPLLPPCRPCVQAKVDLDSREAKDQVVLLFEAASLTGGFQVDSPKDFAARIYALMGGSSGGSRSDNGEVKQVDAEVV